MKQMHKFMIILLASASFSSQASDNISLGIFPYVSANKIIAHHNSLRLYLEKTINKSIHMETAHNVKQYIDNVKKSKYDLIFTAPHIGYLSEKQAGYQRVAETDHFIQGVFIARKDSPIKSLQDVSGKTLGIASLDTILSQVAFEQLIKLDKIPNKNITILKTSTHNNAMYTVLNKKSDFSLTGNTLWNNFPPQHKAELKEIGLTYKIPGFMIMANASLSPELVTQIQNALLAFSETPEGKKYMFNGFKLIPEEHMKLVAPFASNL